MTNSRREGEFAPDLSLFPPHCGRGERLNEKRGAILSQPPGVLRMGQATRNRNATWGLSPSSGSGTLWRQGFLLFCVYLVYPPHLTHTWLWAGTQRVSVEWMRKWIQVSAFCKTRNGWGDTDLMRSSLCICHFQELLKIMRTLRGIHTTI